MAQNCFECFVNRFSMRVLICSAFNADFLSSGIKPIFVNCSSSAGVSGLGTVPLADTPSCSRTDSCRCLVKFAIFLSVAAMDCSILAELA